MTSFVALGASAQVVVDTVSIGAGYSNQVWYSLSDDEQGTAAKAEWDLGFDLSPQGFSILLNPSTGILAWTYPAGDTSDWASIDTTGLSTWSGINNSDTSWALGAFSNYVNPNDPFDVGWGIYSLFTHYVTGDSLYIVKLANGDYKKLWIEGLAAGTYTFRHADLNGNNEVSQSITKSTYGGKTFVYYAIAGDQILDREPAAADWDLMFGQYTTYIPIPYLVTGVLSKPGVNVAQADGIGNVNTYTSYGAHTFTNQMNEIGYDWKAFGGGGWVITDSLVYFVGRTNGEIWKMVFTGFGGSSTGDFIFSKEKLASVGTVELGNVAQNEVFVYPNPSAQGGQAQLVYRLAPSATAGSLKVIDMAGRVVLSKSINAGGSLQTLSLETANLQAGIYTILLESNGRRAVTKWSVQ